MANLRRSARRHTAGVDPTDYWEFTPGDRVRVVEGFLGTVTAVEDGPFPGSEQYVVELDGGLGGGEYDADELQSAEQATAAKTSTTECNGNCDSGHIDPECPKHGTQATASAAEASVEHTAADDYPELSEILVERPPLPHSERIASLQTEGGIIDRLLYPWAEKALQTQEESGYGGRVDLQTGRMPSVDWCRFRRDRECWYPKELDKPATELAGYAVYIPVNRGLCWRDKWDDQRACHVAEPGPKSGHPDALPDATRSWSQGGQRFASAPQVDRSVVDMTRKDRQEPAPTLGDELIEEITEAVEQRRQKRDSNPYGTGSANPYTAELRDGEFPVRFTVGATDHTQQGVRRSEVGGEGNPRGGLPHLHGDASGGPASHLVRGGQDGSALHLGVGDGAWSGSRGHGTSPSVSASQVHPTGAPATGDAWGASDDPRLATHGVQAIWASVHAGEHEDDAHWSVLPGVRPGAQAQAKVHHDLEFQWHFTAKWKDVQSKAKRLKDDGHVRVISSSPVYLVGEVRGDTNVYQTTLMREPGSQRVAMWECGCAWAAYSWGRSGRWKKYEGRLCSHALALNYEGQAQGWGGGSVSEQTQTPSWRADPSVTVKVPGDYQRPETGEWRVGSTATTAGEEVSGGTDSVLEFVRPVHTEASLSEAPAIAMVRDMLSDGDDPNEVIATLAALGVSDAPALLAEAMAARPFEVNVRGRIVPVLDLLPGTNLVLVDGLGEVPASECLNPKWHPTKGITSARTAERLVPLVVGPGTFYRIHPRGRPFEVGGGVSKVFDHDQLPEDIQRVFRPIKGYSAFANPEHLRQYAEEMGWNDTMGEYGLYIVTDPIIRFEGEVSGQGADGEPVVIPTSGILETIEWPDFVDRIEVTPIRPNHWSEGWWEVTATQRTAAQSTGCMVAIEIPRSMAQALHDQISELWGGDAESVTEYHVTLAYPGDAAECDLAAVRAAVEEVARSFGPMEGRLSGYGVFHQENQDNVLYASVDIPGLERLRQGLVNALERHGVELPDNHGFTPHLTLLYTGEANTPTPPTNLPEECQEPFTVSELSLVVMDDWHHFRLDAEDPATLGHGAGTPWGFLPWGGNDVMWVVRAGDDPALVADEPLHLVAPPLQGTPEAASSVTFDPYVFEGALGDDRYDLSLYDGESYESARGTVVADFTAELHDEPEPALPEVTAEDPVADFTGDETDVADDPSIGMPAAVVNEDPELQGEIVPGDPRLAHLMAGSPKTSGDKEMNIAAAAKAHLAKTALKAFTPAEQAQIIEEGSAEGVVAANLDRLDLTGTHYMALEEALASAEAEGDDDLWLL